MNSWPSVGAGVDASSLPPLQAGILPNRTTRVIIIYPTVDPQVVVVPIVSSIFFFPIVVFLIICWLRKMAAKRRQRARLAHRDDFWNERSCASIVQRSPPLSLSLGNGCSGGGSPFGNILGSELATTTMEIEMVEQRYDAITQLSSPNNNIENGVRPMPNEEIVLTPPSPICGENVGNGGARVGGTTTRIPGLIYSSVV